MAFHRQAKHKARKKHVCDWCGKLILKDCFYFYSVGVTDGDFSTLKTHTECNDQIKWTLDKTIAEPGEYDLNQLRDLYSEMNE